MEGVPAPYRYYIYIYIYIYGTHFYREPVSRFGFIPGFKVVSSPLSEVAVSSLVSRWFQAPIPHHTIPPHTTIPYHTIWYAMVVWCGMV